jgi:hypothetical protein
MLATLIAAVPAIAQDFSAPAPAGEANAAALLEHGLAAGEPTLEVMALATRWHGLAELQTRSLALSMGWRSARGALGISQTGDPELGWSALSAAAGGGTESGGFALRACARRRGDSTQEASVTGGEVGAGAWMEARRHVVVWASAPQLWIRGDPPPLERWLQCGVRVELAEARLWVARSAAPGAPRGLRAEHLAGIATRLGVARLWIEARDHPPRGTLGLAARAGVLQASVAVEGHPVLGETVRAALALGERP